ncbi:Rieske 2Fe-2S domain-containing protein [Paraburkholderia fungorum]
MYPLDLKQPYPRNQWYIAAWGNELNRVLFERRILDEPIVFYRTEAGQPVALAGLCPHRLYPLREGRLIGDQVECGYHGFRFDCAGRCTTIPAQDHVPAKFGTRYYPVADRWEWTWIWMGDPALADPATIPAIDRIGLGTQGWRGDAGVVRQLRARYTLLIDNLMDLSHISFSHAKSLPGNEIIATIAATLSESPDVFRVERALPKGPVAGFTAYLHPDLAGQIADDGVVSEYFGPCLINAGGPYTRPADGSPMRGFNFIHGLTPETPTTTHYFNAISRNFRLDDDELSAAMLAQMDRVIAEDVIVLEEIETHVDRHASTKTELSCQADAGAIRVRRKLAGQITEEDTVR